jgi:glycosyltransferase involved in cell wall biosynthesis
MEAGRHILFVEMGTGIGGATKCLRWLVEQCANQGWRASVALAYPLPELETAGAPWATIPLYADRAFRRGQRIRRVAEAEAEPGGRIASAARFLAAVATADVPVARWLAAYARRHRVDLIHANNELLANRAAILAGRRAGLPVVAHQRGWPCRSWANRPLARWADRIVAVSDAVAASLTEVGLPAHKIRRIYDGVDAKYFATAARTRIAVRRSWGLAPDDEVIGLPAVLVPWKGHELFLEAFARVANRRPRARALLIGASPANANDLRPALASRIDELGLHDRVRLTGHVDDMPGVYGALDLVVHTSLEPEPFGLVVLEAMAAGRVMVAADAGGPAEIINHAADGWLYPMGDVNALANAMILLMEDGSLRRRLAAQAPERARCFDPAVVWGEMLATYQAAMNPAEPGNQGRLAPHRVARQAAASLGAG